jgi:periplasmic protein TonB
MPRGGFAVGLVGTTVVHLAALAALVASVMLRPKAYQPTIYSVELVAAPAPTRPPKARTETPPAPPPPPVAPTKPEVKKAPVPKPKVPKKIDPKVEPTTKPVTQEVPNPGATPSTGNDVDNVRVEGKIFPFPDYLRRIVNEILRRWTAPTGLPLSAEVSFTIMRDGSVTNIKVVRSSRSYTFDLEAEGAVEQAGADKAFGPLPTGWPQETLDVAFHFTPRER